MMVFLDKTLKYNDENSYWMSSLTLKNPHSRIRGIGFQCGGGKKNPIDTLVHYHRSLSYRVLQLIKRLSKSSPFKETFLDEG